MIKRPSENIFRRPLIDWLVNLLKEKGTRQDFDFIVKQNGMFSFCGLILGQEAV